MTTDLVIKALLLGAVNAAPIGPVGLLCLKRNVESDRWRGVSASLGMALAYGVISFAALFGLKWIGSFLEVYRAPLQLVGGVMLVLMGWRGWKRKTVPPARAKCARRYLGDFTSTLVMTLFNPVPFATFTILLATFKVVSGALDLSSDLYFALGVVGGTLCFWLPVNQLLHMVKKRSPGEWSQRINSAAAMTMILFGVAIFAKGLFESF